MRNAVIKKRRTKKHHLSSITGEKKDKNIYYKNYCTGNKERFILNFEKISKNKKLNYL